MGKPWRFHTTVLPKSMMQVPNFLMQCIAATESSSTLFDLYCGSGAIGIALSDNFESIVGIEVQSEASNEPRKMQTKQRSGTWIAGKVETCLSKATPMARTQSYLTHREKVYIPKPLHSLLPKRLTVSFMSLAIQNLWHEIARY